MSLCDRCYAPGQCCKHFSLYGPGGKMTFWLEGGGTVSEHLERHELPFAPVLEGEYEDDHGRRYGSYHFECPKLTPEGRCSIYEDRPRLCRAFEPAGGSKLCVHSGGAEGTGDGL